MEKTGGKYETAAKCESGDETGTTLGWEREAGPLAGETVTIDFTSGTGELKTGSHDILCTSDEGTGEVSGAATFTKVTFISKGCKDSVFNQSCNSSEPAGKAGEIITNELTAELVYLKSAAKTPAGLLTLPTVGSIFTRISCVGGLVKESVTGELIGEFAGTTINKMAASTELLFEENAGKQLWTKVEEGAATHQLIAFGEPAVEIGTETGKLLVNGVAKSGELMFP
jgi:hypothetical protein